MILTSVLFALAGIANAVMDKLQFHFHRSVFKKLPEQFWNPNKSWMNKYKRWPDDQRAKFPGAKTWGVLFTDAWHLFQAVWILFVILAPITHSGPWWSFAVYFLVYTGTFTLFFHYIFEKK